MTALAELPAELREALATMSTLGRLGFHEDRYFAAIAPPPEGAAEHVAVILTVAEGEGLALDCGPLTFSRDDWDEFAAWMLEAWNECDQAQRQAVWESTRHGRQIGPFLAWLSSMVEIPRWPSESEGQDQ